MVLECQNLCTHQWDNTNYMYWFSYQAYIVTLNSRCAWEIMKASTEFVLTKKILEIWGTNEEHNLLDQFDVLPCNVTWVIIGLFAGTGEKPQSHL